MQKSKPSDRSMLIFVSIAAEVLGLGSFGTLFLVYILLPVIIYTPSSTIILIYILRGGGDCISTEQLAGQPEATLSRRQIDLPV